MNEIYWITRLDLISGWLITFAAISGLVIIISIIAYLGNRSYYEAYGKEADKRWTALVQSYLKYLYLASFSLLHRQSLLLQQMKQC